MAKNDIAAWVREKITVPVLVAFVVGIVLGLVVLGWWLWPVQWANANPADLKTVYQETYLQMIADSYAQTANIDLARTRLSTVKAAGEKDADVLADLDRLAKACIAAGDASSAMRLQALASAVGPTTPQGTEPATGVSSASRTSQLLRIVGIAFFLLLLGAGLVVLLLQLQKRESGRRRSPPAGRQPGAGTSERQPTAIAPTSPENSLARFDTIYHEGDESYDVSYSVESPTGEFLGECGVSALELPGLGSPNRVGAFELWLFDKDDVRTETKILMTEHVFSDAALRERLASKGELVLVKNDMVVPLETANLKLDARIIELTYESSSNAGVFTKLATELDVSRK